MDKISVYTQNRIESRIFTIRGLQVMIDRDLAEMYGVETRVLNQAVKRNIERFPDEFCFQLSDVEFSNWKSQIVMSNFIFDTNYLPKLDQYQADQEESWYHYLVPVTSAAAILGIKNLNAGSWPRMILIPILLSRKISREINWYQSSFV